MVACTHKGPACVECTVVETIALHDVVSTGLTRTETFGSLTRIVWYMERVTENGSVQIPVASIVAPTDTLQGVARRLAAVSALARTDFIGMPQGSG